MSWTEILLFAITAIQTIVVLAVFVAVVMLSAVLIAISMVVSHKGEYERSTNFVLQAMAIDGFIALLYLIAKLGPIQH